MSTSKHTPGPWQVNQSDIGMRMIYVDIARGVVKNIADVVINDETAANAALIAAAPTMLAALYEARATVAMVHSEFNSYNFTDRYGDGPLATERLAIIDAAIAAAEGREVTK